MKLLTRATHNPDVLTCIANLSNDEIFTPPSVACRMLDQLAEQWAIDNGGEILWENSKVTFLDPCSKSGVFLREITQRLVEGLQNEIPDLQERVNHVLTKQVFGISITNLTALLSRRSLYCSKNANGKYSICTGFSDEVGNLWFEPTQHDWIGGKREFRLDPVTNEEILVRTNQTCSFCGAGEKSFSRGEGLENHAYAFIHTNNVNNLIKEMFGEQMHFDVVVGNPPYQLNDSGHGVSARPIYQHFIAQAKNIDPSYICMIVPARWYAGGKGLDDFRAEMLADDRIAVLHDFPDSRDIFPDVGIAGGVCYFLWSTKYSGKTKVISHRKDKTTTTERLLNERGLDIFVRDDRTLAVLEKIARVEMGHDSTDSLILNQSSSFANQVSARKPFGLGTNFRGNASSSSSSDVRLLRTGAQDWISRETLTSGHHLIDKWKVYTSKASNDHAGQPDNDGTRKVLGRTGILPPNTACTETYILLGAFDSEDEAISCYSYATTRFFRFLLSLRATTQDITKSRFSFIPAQKWDSEWTDEALYRKYDVSPEEIGLIEELIRPMEMKL